MKKTNNLNISFELPNINFFIKAEKAAHKRAKQKLNQAGLVHYTSQELLRERFNTL